MLPLVSCCAVGLLGSFGLLVFLALVPVVLALEFLDAARGVDVFHLAGEERVAHRADFDGDGFLGAARDELVAAAARHRALFVSGMDVFIHDRTF